jgi:hypothetical protein
MIRSSKSARVGEHSLVAMAVSLFMVFSLSPAPFDHPPSPSLRGLMRSRVRLACSAPLARSTQTGLGHLSNRSPHVGNESTYFGAGGSSPFTNEYNRGDIDPDATKPGLQVEITVEDAAMFTALWSARVAYRHALGEWPEAACPENRREAGWVRHVPQAEKPDF